MNHEWSRSTGPSSSIACTRSRISSNRQRISRRARLAPRQKCAPPPPNATCGFGVAADVEAVGIGEHLLVAVRGRVEHHDLLALRGSSGRGARRRACAVRRNCTTGEQKRSISSIAPGSSARSARSAASCSGWRDQREHAARDEVARRVAAGVDEQQEEQVELEIGEPLAVDLGVEQHGRDVLGRRARASSRARRRRSSNISRDRARGVGRVARAVHALGQLVELAPVRDRDAHQLRDQRRGQLARHLRDEVAAPRGATASTIPAASSRMRGSSRATWRGVKPRFTRSRSRVCAGGSMSSSIMRHDCEAHRIHVLRHRAALARRRTSRGRATPRRRRRGA